MLIYNALPRVDAALGVVRAEQLDIARLPPGFEAKLEALLRERNQPLTDAEDAVRRVARDLLRNGRYKPTGRGKPASEYLVRAAQREEFSFPRINAPVDVCNFISLKSLWPISLWDLDLAGTAQFRFRLGAADEVYTFNTGGQIIKLEDLVVGCRILPGTEAGEPIVNPVKDSLATKTTDTTSRVAACIYTSLTMISREAIQALCAEFADLLAGCGEGVDVTYSVVLPGEQVAI